MWGGGLPYSDSTKESILYLTLVNSAFTKHTPFGAGGRNTGAHPPGTRCLVEEVGGLSKPQCQSMGLLCASGPKSKPQLKGGHKLTPGRLPGEGSL
jgi:hypothetical protein